MKQEITKETLVKLKEELDHLENVERKNMSERLRQAIAFGDLSENFAYKEAKEAQEFLERRIIELKYFIKNSVIAVKKTSDRVGVGSVVEVEYKFEKENPEKMIFTIVGSSLEADPVKNKITGDSPLGKIMFDKKVGEKFGFITPGGKGSYKILGIN